jgi:hypothetical protein
MWRAYNVFVRGVGRRLAGRAARATVIEVQAKCAGDDGFDYALRVDYTTRGGVRVDSVWLRRNSEIEYAVGETLTVVHAKRDPASAVRFTWGEVIAWIVLVPVYGLLGGSLLVYPFLRG